MSDQSVSGQPSRAAEPGGSVAVVGGGLIGLAIAWRLAQRERSVTVIDPAPVAAASRAAAGMLAPVSEVRYGETDPLRLSTESLRRYPAFVAELERATGDLIGLRRDGTLVVATDAGDRGMLVDLHRFQRELGLAATLLTSRECREHEPLLSPAIRCGLLVQGDHSVDNRRLGRALLKACVGAGVRLLRDSVTAVGVVDGRAGGLQLATGVWVAADTIVIAAGPWSAEIGGLPEDARPAVRPVKGQILRLRARGGLPLPSRTVRGLVNGSEIYLVPRADGELVVGATVEDMGFDTTIRAGAVHELLRDARAIVPSVDELELAETTAALRPGSPDNAPIIGLTSVEGLVLATGHHRNGVLLTPITADLVAGLITGDGRDPGLEAVVSPRRFERIGVSA